MVKLIKLISIFFIIINFAYADSTFFDDGVKKYNEKNMKNLNFYFKEA